MKTIQPNGMVLVSASAFYRNDKKGGVGVHYPKPLTDFVKDVDYMLAAYDANALPEDIHRQMKEFGAYLLTHETLTEKVAWIAFLNIVWLESRGHLIPDNFNGGLWQWKVA